MSMIPSVFGESSLNSSNFNNQFGINNPFSITMYWQETTFVVSANVNELIQSTEDLKIEIKGRNVLLIINGEHCIKSCELPNNLNLEMSTTSINNGVVIVKIPKEEKKKQIKKKNPPVIGNNFSRGCGIFFC